MPLRPTTYTFADLRQNVKRLFGDESGVQLDDTDIVRWANEGQQAIVARNRILRSKSSSTTTAGTDTYTFPDSDIYEVSSIEIEGQLVPHISIEDAELRIMRVDPNKEQSGRPEYWYLWDDEFTLWPVPDASYDLTLRYVRLPNKLTGSASESLDVPDKYYSALVDYVMAKCYEMDEAFDASGAKMQSFEAHLSIHGEEERNAQEMRHPVIREVDYWDDWVS